MKEMNTEEVLNNLLLELRRGTIVLSVLSQLNTPQYGYSLVVMLGEKGIPVEAGTLYPLLRRLENQNLLESEWEVDGAKPRKYYKLSDAGKATYELLRVEWQKMVKNMNDIMGDKE